MNRIESKFKELKKKNKKAFIAFITAGYPNLGTTEDLIKEFNKIDVDILELGVPFTDPMADGSMIQEASQQALKRKVRLIDILDLVKRARRTVNIPICLMTYYNPIFCFGEEKFIKRARECGVDGVIVPDLPPEEGKDLIKAANKAGIDIICFLAPTSGLDRIKMVARVAKGFIYYVSLTGVTGARNKLPLDLKKKLKLIKKITDKPVCVGFGVSTRAQVKEVQKFSDGVIVGSAIVRKIKENIAKKGLQKKVSEFAKGLKG
ncbi:MAG: tryptophan synthase subunit alpha [Candidatus Omnitrophica bacterium]|nr:tryptophan synthase subunit alpha [Candidatus Omnitrophota bacterium]MBU1870013.1 tryptophan synthase subunit alpha [Candidatus Omnitrophota bacterium]